MHVAAVVVAMVVALASQEVLTAAQEVVVEATEWQHITTLLAAAAVDRVTVQAHLQTV
jgi:hypothetical protein